MRPILRGFHPDPSICRGEDAWYLVNSTFEFFPGLPVSRSEDLVHWECVGHVAERPEQLGWMAMRASRGLFAATIRTHQGKWYVTVTDVTRLGNCLFVADHPQGPWSDPIPIAMPGIDPSLFFDGDGKAYLLTNGAGIIMAPVDLDTGTVLASPRLLTSGSGGRYPEGPHLYVMNGWYYLMLAEGGTEYGHMETLFRSSALWGPYQPCPYNPILSSRDRPEEPVQCLGHADLTPDGEGRWKAVFLGVRPLPGLLLHALGRETFLGTVVFDVDGWFHIQPDEGTFKESVQNIVLTDREEYLSPRVPQWMPIWKDGDMRLRGNGSELSSPMGNPSFFGIRQQEFGCRMRTLVHDWTSSAVFGVAAYLSNDTFLNIRVDTGANRVSLWQCLHGMTVPVSSVWMPDGLPDSLVLEIVSDPRSYQFRWGNNPEHLRLLGSLSVAGLCAEGTRTMTFTGVLVGPYAECGEVSFRSLQA